MVAAGVAVVAALLADSLSWLVTRRVPGLGGDAAGSGRRWAIALTSGVLAGSITLRTGVSWLLPAYVSLAVLAVVLSAIDLTYQRLPNAIVIPAIPWTLLMLAVAAWGRQEWGSLGRAVAAGLVLFTFYFVTALLSPSSMGMGDVKLSVVIGLYAGYLSWNAVLLSTLVACIAAALVGLALLAIRRAHRRTMVPFGPSMMLGALVTIWLATG